MKLNSAIIKSLGDIESPAFTNYLIGVVIFRLYQNKTYKGEPISKITNDSPTLKIIKNKINELAEDGILTQIESNIYTLLGRSHPDVMAIACAVDPFCYVSHLSAMEFHGLTERIPSKLYLSSPTQKLWNEYAINKMQKDLGDGYATYLEEKLPNLSKKMPHKIGKIETHIINTKHTHSGAFKNINDRAIRVSTIGRTFLEMIKKPEFCGGLKHVIATFEEHSKMYLRLIVSEIDRHGATIDKIRTGYILDELVGVQDDTVESWNKLRRRGGSMKLDMHAEYHHEFSEKWWISLNLF